MSVIFVATAFSGADPTITNTSATFSTAGLTSISLHASLAGSSTPNVTVAFYASNEETPTSWMGVTDGSVTFSATGQKLLRINSTYRWLEVVTTNGGGTGAGTLDVWLCGNGPD